MSMSKVNLQFVTMFLKTRIYGAQKYLNLYKIFHIKQDMIKKLCLVSIGDLSMLMGPHGFAI